MAAQVEPWEIEQGTTFIYSFVWREGTSQTPGAPINLDNSEIRAQVRKTQQSPVLIEATNGGATPYITHGGATGQIDIEVPYSVTDLLTTKAAKYDLEVTLPNGRRYRVLEGAVKIKPNITQDSGEPVLT